MILYRSIAFVLLLFAAGKTKAQQLSIDRGVRVEGLWCFPLVTDTLQYVYLPDRAQLSVDEVKNPQFSFVRYVNSLVASADTSQASIKQAQGGGILHLLVTYDTDDKKVARAQGKLRELLNNDAVLLRGPIVFKSGRFALVSSILNPADGNMEKKLLAVGDAPVLEGSRIALSFEMDPQRSKLLLESFKMATPDVSLVFDLVFSGLSDSYQATLTVDWSQVQKYENISAGAKVYFVSAEVEKMYEELRRTSAIKLETAGSDDKMEPLLNNVYNKLTDLIFQRVEPEMTAPAERDGITGLLNGLFSSGGQMAASKIFPFSVHAAYKVKDIKSSGSSVLHFNSRLSSDRHHYITFNIGDIYKKYGSDTKYFSTVSLSDPDFEQRNIFVGVDGAILPEFDKLINSITVTLRKQHANGKTTLRELNILKNNLNESKPISVAYDAVGDSDRLAWLNYEYMAQFQFKGGKSYATPWLQQSASMINLFTPYHRKQIQLEGDSVLLQKEQVRAVFVRIEYSFFGETRKIETYVKPEENIQGKLFEVTLPLNQLNYRYTLTWMFKDGKTKTATGDNDTELLFIDNIPAT